MNDGPQGPPRTRLRAYHLLALVPAIGMLGGVPHANHVRTRVVGLPFLLFWILGWVIATSVCMGLLNYLDRRHDRP
jgi:Protein of unknown function (DUF3311)